MGGSLFEQLQKSGLVDEKKAKRARHEQQKEARQARHQRGKKAPPPDQNAVAIEQARAHKAEKDRALNRQQKLAAEQKAVAAQIKQLVEMNRVDGSDGEIGFNFTDDNSVQRVYVTELLRNQLVRGYLGIVKTGTGYCLVPTAVAEKIRQRDPASVIVSEAVAPSVTDEDDPYADFQVPDDLMW